MGYVSSCQLADKLQLSGQFVEESDNLNKLELETWIHFMEIGSVKSKTWRPFRKQKIS